ncbi:MAG: response regulator [Oligoflexia bacterium]|nr:response regulator [Oligoflexia bacterium]
MSLKMLIVDDSKPIFLMVSQMVKELGHEPHWAAHGLEAVEKCQEMEFDVILLDWNMPEMDGMEFLEKNLAENVTSAPIIMMTTENKPEKIQAAIEKGAVEYIMKPFTTDILQSKLDMAGI